MPDGLTPPTSSRLLLTTDAVGGVWRYSLDLARSLSPRPLVAVLGPAPSPTQRAEADSLGVHLIETGLPLDWTAESPADLAATAAALQHLAERAGASTIHLHAPALAGAVPWPIPVVAVSHSCVATWWDAVRGGPLPPDLAWRATATATGLRTAAAVITPTAAHAAATERLYGPLPITTVHNGTPTSSLLSLPLAGEGRGEGGATNPNLSAADPTLTQPSPAGETGPSPAILTAGRLWDDAKNAAALNRAAPTLDAPIRAAGPLTGPNGARIDLPNLHLLGTLSPDAMRRAYADATVFASLARYEPFGLAVLEAAAAGLHLVLSDIPSFRELWDGVARFVPPGADPAPALRAALADPTPAPAAERAKRYTLNAMVEGTLAVHRRLGARVP